MSRSSAPPLAREAYGPQGDPDRHRSLRELTALLAALPGDDRESGRVARIVQRQTNGERAQPTRARLSTTDGLLGDGWARRPPRDPEAQIAVIHHGVAQLIANGQDPAISGDNLYVELDISAANLPAGTRLQVGDAILEVSPKPHNGCAKFHDRFGADALRFVQTSTTRHLNLRGIYWRVVSDGEVWIDAPIKVLSRPPAIA